jgi:hypothetical protein
VLKAGTSLPSVQDDITSLLNMLDENKGKAADGQKATAESEESSLVQSDADFKTAARLVPPPTPNAGAPTHPRHTHTRFKLPESCRAADTHGIRAGYSQGTHRVLAGY